MARPRIGITVDNREVPGAPKRYDAPPAYSRAVAKGGGLPLLLPQEVELVGDYLELCDGLLLTGGNDPHMEPFGRPTHACATRVDPQRQAFEIALLELAARERPDLPILGVCFGMQLMALLAGGDLHQHLPEVLLNAQFHRDDHRHEVLLAPGSRLAALSGGERQPVASWHHQAVRDPGGMVVSARAPDGVIEAVEDPRRPFYVGVQWHPERSGDGPLGSRLMARLVEAAARTTSSRTSARPRRSAPRPRR